MGKKPSHIQTICRNSAKSWNRVDEACCLFQRQDFMTHLVVRIFFPGRGNCSQLSLLTGLSKSVEPLSHWEDSNFKSAGETERVLAPTGMSCICILSPWYIGSADQYFKEMLRISYISQRNWRGQKTGCPNTSYKQSKEIFSSLHYFFLWKSLQVSQLSEWSGCQKLHAHPPTLSWVWGQERPQPM